MDDRHRWPDERREWMVVTHEQRERQPRVLDLEDNVRGQEARLRFKSNPIVVAVRDPPAVNVIRRILRSKAQADHPAPNDGAKPTRCWRTEHGAGPLLRRPPRGAACRDGEEIAVVDR